MSASVRILPSGHEFVVEADEPLLEAALRSGLALEFGCTNGSCGACKARVREGEVRQIRFHDYVIRDAEKRDGAVLLRCCTADGDVTIEAGEAGGPDDIPMQNVRARLYTQEQAADGVAIVHLRVMRGKMLRFLAGQHVRLKLSGTDAADVSIASCPCDGLNLEFHFDPHNAGDLSARAFAGFVKSDRIEIDGPRGRFILDETSGRALVFIASDTAIAPVKSIIEHAINLEIPQPIYLRWHATGASGHYMHNYFRSLTDALDEFSYAAVEGGVSAESLVDLPDLSGADVYLAGGEEFAAAAKVLLLEGGLPEERLFIDALNLRPPAEPRAG
jgi:CDP-4-dehydro-6-deoxyglucose reductase